MEGTVTIYTPHLLFDIDGEAYSCETRRELMIVNHLLRGKVILWVLLASMTVGCWALQSKPDDNSIRDIVIQESTVWVCGHNRLDRIDLSNNSVRDEYSPISPVSIC
jgi:hypothetical protein